MKKNLFTFLALCVVWLLVPWHSANAQEKVLLSENFDNVAVDALPEGWTTTGTYKFSVVSSNSKVASRGSNFAMCDSYMNQQLSTMTTGEITIPETGDYVLSFDYCGEPDMNVYALEGETEITIKTGVKSSTSSWRNSGFISLSTIQGKTVKLIFKFTGNYGDYNVGIDDIHVELAPTCAQPKGLAVTTATDVAAMLTWIMPEGAGAVATDYVYTLNGESNDSYVISNPTVNGSKRTAVITGLTPDTEYTIAIAGKCSADDISNYSDAVKFTTGCAALSMSDFTNGTSGKEYTFTSNTKIPECWSYVGTPNFMPSGDYKLELEENEKLYSQYLQFDINGLELCFSAKNTSTVPEKAAFGVGIEYISGGQLVAKEVAEYQLSTTEFTELFFNADSLDGKDITIPADASWRFAFYSKKTSTEYQSEYTMYLASMKAYNRPAYNPVKDIVVKNIEKESITLGWTAGDENTDNYIVEYKLNGGETVKVGVTGATEYTIDGLTAATRYNIEGRVWAATTADVEEASLSREMAFSFQGVDTKGDPINISATESWSFDFTGMTANTKEMPVGWGLHNNGDGSTYFYIEKEQLILRNYSVDKSNTVLLPEFNFNQDVTDYRFSFKMKRSSSNSNGKFNIFVLTERTLDATDLTATKTIPLYYNAEPVVNDANNYYYYNVDFAPVINGNAVKYILLEVISDNKSNLYFDNFNLAVKPEVDPITRTPVISEITNRTAKVTVVLPEGEGYKFQAGYAVKGETFDETVKTTSNDGENFLTLPEELAGNTEYDLYVRAMLGEKTSPWSEPVTFRTLCDPETIDAEIGWIDGFEKENTGELTNSYSSHIDFSGIPCYSATGNVYAKDDSKHTYNAYTLTAKEGTRYFYSTERSSTYYIFKQFNLKAGVTYRMSAYGFAQSSSPTSGSVTLKMICNKEFNSSDVDGYKAFLEQKMGAEALSNTQNWKEYFAYFTVEEDGVYYTGMQVKATSFGSYSGTNIYALDQWTIEEIPFGPVEATVTPTAEEATFTFTGGEEGNIYHLRVSTEPFNTDEIDSRDEEGYQWTYSTDEIEAATYSWTSTEGLAPATLYYYAVRRTDGIDYSPWSLVQSFETPCSTIPAEGYVEGFRTDNALKCWTVMSGEATLRHDWDRDGRVGYVNVDKNSQIASPYYTSINDYTLRGTILSNIANKNMELGVIDEDGIYTKVTDITTIEGWKYMDFEAEITIPESTSNFVRFTLKTPSDSYFYIDTLSLVKVTCKPLATGEITSIGSTSAKVQISTTGQEQEWKLIARPEKGDDIVKEGITDITNPVEITDLTPNTAYTLYVVSVCSAEDSSSEVRIGTMTTDCVNQALPYSDKVYSGMPACWSAVPDAGLASFTWKSTFGEGLVATIDMANVTDKATALLLTPRFTIDERAIASFRFATYGNKAKLSVVIIDEEGNEHATSVAGAQCDKEYVNMGDVKEIAIDDFAGQAIRLGFKAEVDKAEAATGTAKAAICEFTISGVYNRYVKGSFNEWNATDDNLMTFDVKTGEYFYETVLNKGSYEFNIASADNNWERHAVDASKSHKGFTAGTADDDNVEISIPADGTTVQFRLMESANGVKGDTIAIKSSCGYFAAEPIEFALAGDDAFFAADNLMTLAAGKFAEYTKVYRNVYLTEGKHNYRLNAGIVSYPAAADEYNQIDVTDAGNYELTITYRLDSEFAPLTYNLTDLPATSLAVTAEEGTMTDNQITLNDLTLNQNETFTLTVKGTNLTDAVKVNITGEGAGMLTADLNEVSIDEATAGKDVVFTLKPTTEEEGTATITISTEGLQSAYTVNVAWTVTPAPKLAVTAKDIEVTDGKVTLENLTMNEGKEFKLNVKGENLTDVVTIAVTGDNAANIAYANEVSIEDATTGKELTFTVTPTTKEDGSATITISTEGAETAYELQVAWTVLVPATPEIIVEGDAIGEDGAIDLGELTANNETQITITVKGTDLRGDIIIAVSGDDADAVKLDKATVEMADAATGAEITVTITTTKEAGSARLTFTSEGAEEYELPVSWTIDPTTVDVNNISLNTVVYTNGGVVYVAAPEGSVIEVYSLQGQTIVTAEATSDLTAINGIETGVVVVRVNGVAHKVIVK